MSNPFGIRSTVINNIELSINQGMIEDTDELTQAVDDCIEDLNNARKKLLIKLKKVWRCNHEFNPPTCSFRRRFAEPHTIVFIRECKFCGAEESHHDSAHERPEWTYWATKLYRENN